MSLRFSILLSFVLLAGGALATPVDYATQIKPLLKLHCVKCHGATTQKAGLRLDTAAALKRGGGRGPGIIVGKSAASLLIQVIKGPHEEVPQMPYKRGPLDSSDQTLLRQWIDEGAQSATAEQPSDDHHWAYIAPKRPEVSDSSINPIDYFVRRSLAKEGLAPSVFAVPETRLRRLYLDLTGLPPLPLEVDQFVADLKVGPESEVWIKRIKQLLSSPHYGERWGRWWLDQARYADSNGYSIDAPRSMWPFRDWVVQALNRDLPFDQFSIEQLAGDMLPGATTDQVIATGFHRNTQINQEGGIDKEQFRIESVFDRVATTGTVWLGLTVGCAQCHDHKFDAISHKEYYELFAFFNNQDEPTLPVSDPSLHLDSLKAEQKRLIKELDAYVLGQRQALGEWEKSLPPAQRKLVSAVALKLLNVPLAKRKAEHWRTLYKSMAGTSDSRFNTLFDRLTEISARLKGGATTLVMRELLQPRKTTLFIKGDFTRPSEEVHPAVPAALHSLAKPNPSRLDFAQWLVDRRNPLTARVIMNRVWQQYFGRGLVDTENDFGTMGSQPTHPELLDWLAVEFMDSGWSLKHMHEVIVTSATYQQSSKIGSPSRLESVRDPNNRFLWRQNRLRLDAELVRDVCLASSGLLSPKVGGPPVYPPIPESVLSLGQVKHTWPVSRGEDRYRRGLYTFIFRSTPPPALSVFDAPEGFSTCTRRLRSNTPLQALTLLNDAAFFEFAEALSKRVKEDGLEAAFRRCTSRLPTSAEMEVLAHLTPLEAARVLLNLDETITRE